jgi:tetratricopeptide (TPR) repeat protein
VKTLLAISTFLLLSTASICQELSELPLPPNGDAEKAEVSQWIGLLHISIAYHSPRVHRAGNDRTGHIWGELVKYGFFDDGFGPSTATPWRAGANENTTVTFSHEVKVGGKDLKAGTYALFLELAETGPWQWIFSNQTAGWGSFQYDPKYDALRVPATPQDAPFTEYLTYEFGDRLPDSAVAFLQWEKKRIPMKVEVPNINELYVDQMRKNLLSWPGFNYQNWQTAAQFCADNKINLEEALVWAEGAIKGPFRGATIGREDFSTLQTKAAVLAALGRTEEADKVMQGALQSPGTAVVDLYQYEMQLLREKRNELAVKTFETSRKQHPTEKFWTSLGLARGYTAVGDKKNAIANWELVLANIPPNLAGNAPRWQEALKKLKEGNSN